MKTAQRVVRLGIWILMPLMLLGSLDVAATMYWNFSQTRDLLTLPSPDGRYAATVSTSQSGCVQATTRSSTIVFVERRFAGLKTGMISPFCVDDPEAKVVLSWPSFRTLQITCQGCPEGSFGVTNTNWGELRFAFDLSR